MTEQKIIELFLKIYGAPVPSGAAIERLKTYTKEVEDKTLERAALVCETSEVPIDIEVWLGTKKELTAATAIGLAAAIRALKETK